MVVAEMLAMLAKLIITLVGCRWSWVGGDVGQAAKLFVTDGGLLLLLIIGDGMAGRFIGCRFIDNIG